MILADTGFIVATLVRSDNLHVKAVAALQSISIPLATTWPCLTEAAYLTAARGGTVAQFGLLRQVESGFLNLIAQSSDDALRACELMRLYADAPMGFADASLGSPQKSLALPEFLPSIAISALMFFRKTPRSISSSNSLPKVSMV